MKMTSLTEYQNMSNSGKTSEDEDSEWESDFEETQAETMYFQEIQDNLINESREASLLNSSVNNFQNTNAVSENNSQVTGIMAENLIAHPSKSGAIPKIGFSYLSNRVNTDISKILRTNEMQSRIDATSNEVNTNLNSKDVRVSSHSPNITSQQKSNPVNMTHSQVETEIQQTNELVNKREPKNSHRKLKPEAFSFLSETSSSLNDNIRNVLTKERKHLVPTAIIHARTLNNPRLLDDSPTISESANESANAIPTAPQLIMNHQNNYEQIDETMPPGNTSFREIKTSSFDLTGNEIATPPLPTRPPPVFKYPLGTFSNSRSVSTESATKNTEVQSLTQTVPIQIKYDNSPPSSLENKIMIDENKFRNRKKDEKNSPSITPVPLHRTTRPLPPLPVSGETNRESNAPNSDMIRLENAIPVPNTESSEFMPTRVNAPLPDQSKTSIYPLDELSSMQKCSEHVDSRESILQDKPRSTPQQRLAQIIATHSNVSSDVLLSQREITSAIASRVAKSQSKGLPSAPMPKPNIKDEFVSFSSGNGYESSKLKSSRSLIEESHREDKRERKFSHSVIQETANPPRFTDHEALLSAMSRPLLPQKVIPMQRSVSCNSLVQSIKDLGFSVWNKPEKSKRSSDGPFASKKNLKHISITSPIATKLPTAPPIPIINHEESREDTPQHQFNIGVGLQQVNKEKVVRCDKSVLLQSPWYHDVDSKEAQHRLLGFDQDGTFLVRPSSTPTEEVQHTLCILYDRKVRQMHIREKPDGKYALGAKKAFEKTFSSIPEMLNYHKEIPIDIKPSAASPSSPQLMKILLKETPPKVQKIFA